MKTTIQALNDGFNNSDGYFSFKFGDDYEYELCVEPLLWGQMYVALYKDQDLMTEKIPVKPIDKEAKNGG
jgi:hypothetical protein